MRRTAPLPVSEEDRGLLLSWLGSAGLSADMRLRARVVLGSAGGQGARAIARDLGVSVETVYLWRRRYQDRGIDGLRSLVVPGRRSQLGAPRMGAILRAGRARSAGGAARSVAAVARAVGVSRATVRRVWEQQGVGPIPTERRSRPARETQADPNSIVGILIDLPCRALARVAPRPAPRVGGATPVNNPRRRPGRPREGQPAAAAILTALEAFSGRSNGRANERANERANGRADTPSFEDLLARLAKVSPGASIEILAGPGARGSFLSRGAGKAASVPAAVAPVRVIRARTRGGWLTHATHWLVGAPDAQERSLAAALGHLMDYFATWNENSEPFLWTPDQPPRPHSWG